ncbi:inner nuclear membrane protein Man1-like [Styela clava]|uniref:inner nuclear membrane protein Man1-like n=1 Tax=Styela clava TaxID=7725 RepID=UPI0019392E93|nr:inner nuclear membrane protein Man1-like [Styela clava]
MVISDEDLRTELGRYGVDVGPVTDTTRKVLVKRLEKLQKEQGSKPAIKVNSSLGKSRKTAKATDKRERSSSPILRASRNPRNSRSHSQSTLGYSTDENEDENVKRASRGGSTRSTRQETNRSYAISKELEIKPLTPVHKRIKALANSRKSASLSPKRRSTGSLPKPEKYSDDSDEDSDRSSMDSWVAMESTETNTTPSLAHSPSADTTRNSGRGNDRLEKFRAEIEAWKKEEEKHCPGVLTHRSYATGHSSFRADQNAQTNPKKLFGNGIPNFASKIVTQVTQNRHNAGLFSADDGDEDAVQTQPWTVNFSSFLPIGTCIFFVVLGLLYATMKYDPSLSSRPAIEGKSTMEIDGEWRHIASMIWDHVGTFAGEKECGTSTSTKNHLPIVEVLLDLNIKQGKRNLSYIQASKTFIETPEWGIQFYDLNKIKIEDPSKQEKAIYVGSNQPLLSGWCRFTRALQKVLFRIILTTAVGILIWLGLVYRRYRIEKQREEREQMYTMVQKILEVLRKQYDMSENNEGIQPFLPIVHVRDMIIPPKDRKKMARVWERAKMFLSASETRIRVENQRISGEDYLVWRWIQASSPAKRHTPTSRVWQGEAFDIKAINRPMICPTPCLKIRNMFDPDMEVSKNWVEQIQDSILEKCQGNNEILRICVEKDSNEGLVYMLCASNQGAGRAFQALHGAWFDGRLVTVKFIRLQRFHHRFPDSVNQSKVPMRPTSDVPVSTIINPISPGSESPYEKLYPTLPDD